MFQSSSVDTQLTGQRFAKDLNEFIEMTNQNQIASYATHIANKPPADYR